MISYKGCACLRYVCVLCVLCVKTPLQAPNNTQKELVTGFYGLNTFEALHILGAAQSVKENLPDDVDVADYGGTFGYLQALVAPKRSDPTMENSIQAVALLLDAESADTNASPRNDLLQKATNVKEQLNTIIRIEGSIVDHCLDLRQTLSSNNVLEGLRILKLHTGHFDEASPQDLITEINNTKLALRATSSNVTNALEEIGWSPSESFDWWQTSQLEGEGGGIIGLSEKLPIKNQLEHVRTQLRAKGTKPQDNANDTIVKAFNALGDSCESLRKQIDARTTTTTMQSAIDAVKGDEGLIGIFSEGPGPFEYSDIATGLEAALQVLDLSISLVGYTSVQPNWTLQNIIEAVAAVPELPT